jgi:hypothetical protein
MDIEKGTQPQRIHCDTLLKGQKKLGRVLDQLHLLVYCSWSKVNTEIQGKGIRGAPKKVVLFSKARINVSVESLTFKGWLEVDVRVVVIRVGRRDCP